MHSYTEHKSNAYGNGVIAFNTWHDLDISLQLNWEEISNPFTTRLHLHDGRWAAYCVSLESGVG